MSKYRRKISRRGSKRLFKATVLKGKSKKPALSRGGVRM